VLYWDNKHFNKLKRYKLPSLQDRHPKNLKIWSKKLSLFANKKTKYAIKQRPKLFLLYKYLKKILWVYSRNSLSLLNNQ